MTSTSDLMNEPYQAYLRFLRALHDLFTQGKGDSPEADEIREKMDTPWEELGPEQRERVSGLAADLNWIRRGSVPAERTREQVFEEDLPALHRARLRGASHDVLKYLRRVAPYLPVADVAYLRGTSWMQLGDYETAFLFLQHARERSPDNGLYAYFFLHCVAKIDPERALEEARTILRVDVSHLTGEVLKAAEIELGALQTSHAPVERDAFEHLARLFERTSLRMQAIGEEAQRPALVALASALAGVCREEVGEVDAALEHIARAVMLAPNNDSYRIARGLLLYASDSDRAATDFQEAIRLGTSSIWPYFFLAHFHLLKRDFDGCLTHASKALKLARANDVKSTLFEWIGICQSEMGLPIEAARISFAKAAELGPGNERIRENWQIFERSIAEGEMAEGASWRMENEAMVRAFGKAGYASEAGFTLRMAA